MKTYDVIVVGGGISGAMAAVASARTGCTTLIIEKYGFLGGMLTASGVGPMMTFHAGDKQVIQGLTGELIDRLKQKGKSTGHIFDTTGYTYSVTPFDIEGMKFELENMLIESGGEILYHTMLADVTVDENRINSIRICNKAGLSELKAKVFIDATGDADLSAWAGVNFTKGRKKDHLSQPMTMKLRMTNVDIDQIKDYIKMNPSDFPGIRDKVDIIDKSKRLSIGGFVSIVKEARKNGEINFERDSVLLFETNNKGEVIINTSRVLGKDSTDPWSLSLAEIEGRRQAAELVTFLTKRVPGFKNAKVEFTGPSIGVRGSRQIKGLYTLTAEDLLSCKKFDDVIVHSGYPIDIHSPDGAESKTKKLGWGEVYSIPYRTLINDRVANLITVGRSISSTFEAQAAIRVTPTCGAIGHAGGVAATLAVKSNQDVTKINTELLQSILIEQNVYLEKEGK